MTAVDSPSARLARHLGSWRQDRLSAGEDPSHIETAIADMGPQVIDHVLALLDPLDLQGAQAIAWALTPAAHLKLMAIIAHFLAAPSDVTELSFGPLMASIMRENGFDRYRLRMLENLLRQTAWPGGARPVPPSNELGEVSVRFVTPTKCQVTFEWSELGRGLWHVLQWCEHGDRPLHFTTMKHLLDLFELRTDDLDRATKEETYLDQMRNSRDDKARLLEFVRPGVVVDIGCGSGVMLDLLEQNTPPSGWGRVLGLERSSRILRALEGRRSNHVTAGVELIEGDALELDELLQKRRIHEVSTVIFCSVLHEVYSFAGFDMSAIERTITAAIRMLGPGGRLVIRDGVIPDDGEEMQFMSLQPEASYEFFQAFVEQFGGRKIVFEVLHHDRDHGGRAIVRLRRCDAMEFMYTFIWGRAAFPYEVREQYGVLTRAAYLDLILRAGQAQGVEVQEVEVPSAWRTYLQPDYAYYLEDRVRLNNLDGTPAHYPPSQMILVVERV